MTTVQVDPGVCGFITKVEAVSEDQEEVKITVKSGCESVRKMRETPLMPLSFALRNRDRVRCLNMREIISRSMQPAL